VRFRVRHTASKMTASVAKVTESVLDRHGMSSAEESICGQNGLAHSDASPLCWMDVCVHIMRPWILDALSTVNCTSDYPRSIAGSAVLWVGTIMC
jgi:hypothetical protein